MAPQYLILTAVGIALLFWGLPASHRLAWPLKLLASFAVLGGLIAALLGVLLFMVPDFFRT